MRLLIEGGASRAEVDRAHGHAHCTVGLVEIVGQDLETTTSNVTAIRRSNTSGNPNIVTMFELLVSGQHGQSVLDCFLSCRDSAELTERQQQAASGCTSPRSSGPGSPRREQLQLPESPRPPELVAMSASPAGGGFGGPRDYWANDSLAAMLRCTSARGESLLHRAYLQQMLSATPNSDVHVAQAIPTKLDI